MTTFTYINFLRLDGDELDADFERACRAHGADDSSEVGAIPIRSLTGHISYIVEIANLTPQEVHAP